MNTQYSNRISSSLNKVSEQPARKQYTQLSIVDQVKQSFLKKNRMASILGGIIGGIIPLATYVIGHYETQERSGMWFLVAAGLLYSAITVFNWAKVAFKSSVKAVGFCILLEGTMTFAATEWLSVTCLCVLIGINAVSAGCQLALDKSK